MSLLMCLVNVLFSEIQQFYVLKTKIPKMRKGRVECKEGCLVYSLLYSKMVIKKGELSVLNK